MPALALTVVVPLIRALVPRILTVTLAVLPVTTFPFASSILTMG